MRKRNTISIIVLICMIVLLIENVKPNNHNHTNHHNKQHSKQTKNTYSSSNYTHKKYTTKNKHKESKYVNVNTIETSGRYDVKKIILMNKNGMTSSYKYADIRIQFKKPKTSSHDKKNDHIILLNADHTIGATRLKCNIGASSPPLLFDSHDGTMPSNLYNSMKSGFSTKTRERISTKSWLPRYLISRDKEEVARNRHNNNNNNNNNTGNNEWNHMNDNNNEYPITRLLKSRSKPCGKNEYCFLLLLKSIERELKAGSIEELYQTQKGGSKFQQHSIISEKNLIESCTLIFLQNEEQLFKLF